MFQPKWPSLGNTTEYGIRGMNLRKLSIIKRREISVRVYSTVVALLFSTFSR